MYIIDLCIFSLVLLLCLRPEECWFLFILVLFLPLALNGLVFMSPLHGGTLGGVTWLFHLCKPKEYRN